ncbi:MAG: hypothetical protein ACHQDC_03780 [Acidimicrobiales bacterium]
MSHPTLARTALAVMAAQATFLGLWAAVAPRSFYDSFPGFGRHWVAVDGPYNEHLVRDFGNLNLALAVITAVAAVSLGTVMVRAVAAAWIVFTVLHFGYHVTHLDPYEQSDAIATMVSLGLAVVLPVVALVASRGPGARETVRDEPRPESTRGS